MESCFLMSGGHDFYMARKILRPCQGVCFMGRGSGWLWFWVLRILILHRWIVNKSVHQSQLSHERGQPFQENKSTSAGSKVNWFRTEMELLIFKVKIESTFFKKKTCPGMLICWGCGHVVNYFKLTCMLKREVIIYIIYILYI